MRIKLLFLSVLATVFIFSSPAKAESYDLKAESLIMNSAKCEVNQPCSFTARVKNLGAEFVLNFPLKAVAGASAFKLDSAINMAPSQGAVIKTNDYITFNFNGVFSQIGSIALSFSIDAAGYLVESDLNNNAVSLTVSAAGYDLAVEALSLWPASPAVGQTCYIRVAVKNNSAYKLYSGAGLNLVKIFPDFTVESASSTEPSLAKVIDSGGYLYYGYQGKFTAAGAKELSFTIDPDDALKESDLANNLIAQKITVNNAADADLAIDSVSFSAPKIILGAPYDISIGLKNIGKISLTSARGFSKNEFSFSLPFFDYGINDLTYDGYPSLTSPLNPGSIFMYKLHGAFNQPGNFNLTFAVNKDKDLTEANYNNNATSTKVLVYKNQAEADSFAILTKTVSFASSTTAIISWKTDVKTTGRVNYNRQHDNVNDNKAEDLTSALEHAVSLNDLKSGETYSYAITNQNGIVEKTEIISNFSMPLSNDIKITAGPSLTVSDKTAQVSWSTNINSSGKIYYKSKGASDLVSTGSDTAAADHKIELKDLAYGQYDYFLSSTSTPGANFKTDWANFEIKAAALPATTVVSAPTAQSAPDSPLSLSAFDDGLYNKLRGKIILKVESRGEAYYVSAKEKKLFYLGKPGDAFSVIRGQGVGIATANLSKIAVGLSGLSGADADKDGLPDAMETALGTDAKRADTDGDGHKDKDELAAGYSPLAKGVKMNHDLKFAAAQKGKIFLQVESRGQAWYVNPADGKRYFLATPADAYAAMRGLGAGVSNSNFAKFTAATAVEKTNQIKLSQTPEPQGVWLVAEVYSSVSLSEPFTKIALSPNDAAFELTFKESAYCDSRLKDPADATNTKPFCEPLVFKADGTFTASRLAAWGGYMKLNGSSLEFYEGGKAYTKYIFRQK